MAAAVGVALVLVGLVFLLASWFPAPTGRNAVVAVAIGALCGSCVLVTSAVATYWTTAYRAQQQVLSAIEAHLPSIPSEATLILDGVCPYHGPAIVFESDWGLTGALRVAYEEKALRGDVVQSDTKLEPRGLRNRIYIVETFHPYADDLLLFDVRDGEVVSLPDATVARRHLESSIAQWTERCPAGREGRGVPVLRTDQIYVGWEDRGFHFR
jgi:hypothetical protein